MVRPSPIDVLLVAGWYPSARDPFAGRFVADQVDALVATGQVRIRVVGFDPVRLTGTRALRDREARALVEGVTTALASGPDPFGPEGTGSPAGVPVARLPVAAWSLAAGGGADDHGAAVRALAERLRRDGLLPDLVHAHVGFPAGWAAAGLAEVLDRPLIVTEHASFVGRLLAEPGTADRYRATLEGAAGVIAVSATLASELLVAVPAIGPRLRVVPNVVATGAFARPADDRPGGPRRADELLFVGRRRPSKGIADLLRAFRIVRDVRPTARLRLVGGDATAEDARTWAGLVAELGIADAIAMEGATDRDGVVAAMTGASVFVHPSPRETFGVVAAEALAAGLPVVAVASGGVEEVLDGLAPPAATVVPPGEPTALAEAIVATLERRNEVDEAVLRAAVEARFSEPVVAHRLLTVYRTALTDGRAGLAGDMPQPRAAGSIRPPAAPLPVLVALDRDRLAERLTEIPAAARGDLVVLTAAGPTDLEVRRSQVVADADLLYRVRAAARPRATGLPRLIRAVTDPIGTIARRDLARVTEQKLQAHVAPAIATALDALQDGDGRPDPPPIVCLDGLDHLAVAPLVRAGRVGPVAGGFDHLVDLAGARAGSSHPS